MASVRKDSDVTAYTKKDYKQQASVPYERRDRGGRKETSGPRDTAIQLQKFVDQRVMVKFGGGRQVTGVLKGYDALFNLVLDETIEIVRRADEPEATRNLGLLVCRGPVVLVVSPVDGLEEIENPFVVDE